MSRNSIWVRWAYFSNVKNIPAFKMLSEEVKFPIEVRESLSILTMGNKCVMENFIFSL